MVQNHISHWPTWKSHIDNQSKPPKTLKGKDISCSGWHCRSPPSEGSSSLGTCCVAFPSSLLRELITSGWTVSRNIPKTSDLLLPPSSLLLTSYLHAFSSVPHVESVLCIRDWDTLGWTKGWWHCAPALWGLLIPTPSTWEPRRGPVYTWDPHSHAVL